MILSFRKPFARFRRDESGSLIVFSLVLFVLLVMVGGFVVDLMRYEATRVTLQTTLDRCVLTAATLDQRLDRETVMRDCVQKAGIGEQLESVTVTATNNSSSVKAMGRADTQPMFLHMLGIEEFDAVAGTAAMQGINNVEIALVLDVSGSMQGAKLAALKLAASDFVDTVLANDTNHRVSIAIVPYNAQVNIGDKLAAQFNLTHPHGINGLKCVEIPDAAYDRPVLSRTMEMPMMANADFANATSLADTALAPNDALATPLYNNVFCRPTPANRVRLPSNNPVALKAAINGLVAVGNTSITLGMKWGVTLLDPAMRPSYAGFIASGDIPATMPGRPFNYRDETMKIVVLMTDGAHVAHNRVTDAYKTGPSGIWLSAGDGHYSVRHSTGRPVETGSNEYYVPHLDAWQATPWDSGDGAAEQDWTNIWAHLKLRYVAWQFYARPLGNAQTSGGIYSTTFNRMVKRYAAETEMDASLHKSCEMAKDPAHAVTVYGIAFGAPDAGKAVIRDCSSPGAFFDVDDDDDAEIRAAFNSIAANITMLRLTQ
jgi:Flp pilus assembly protein TadG